MLPSAVLSVLVKVDGIVPASAQMKGFQADLERTRTVAADADKGMTAAGQGAQRMGTDTEASAAKVAHGHQVIQGAAKVGAIAIAGIGIAAAKTAADYESSMNTLQAVSGASGKEMDALGKQAIKLGADTKLPGTSAQDAAEAMTEMIKAGVSVKDTMGGVRSVLVLSAAAEVDNAKAADIATSAMVSFGLKGKDVTLISDQLANAANASKAEITDVADAMKMAGAVFSSMQRPVLGAKGAMTELNVAIALLAQAGIKGSDAGTSLKQTLLSVASASGPAQDAMRAIYIAAQDSSSAEGHVSDALSKTGKVRAKALDAMTKQSKVQL